jgi:hypothetical protein
MRVLVLVGSNFIGRWFRPPVQWATDDPASDAGDRRD